MVSDIQALCREQMFDMDAMLSHSDNKGGKRPTQAAKRIYSRLLSFPLNLALIAGETTAVHAQPAPPIWPQA
jgi:hypothetical protein